MFYHHLAKSKKTTKINFLLVILFFTVPGQFSEDDDDDIECDTECARKDLEPVCASVKGVDKTFISSCSMIEYKCNNPDEGDLIVFSHINF